MKLKLLFISFFLFISCTINPLYIDSTIDSLKLELDTLKWELDGLQYMGYNNIIINGDNELDTIIINMNDSVRILIGKNGNEIIK